MASIVILPQVTIQPPGRMVGPASIPQNVSGMMLTLDRSSWTDPALVVQLMIDLSMDGGVTWASEAQNPASDPFPIACTLVGGALFNKDGSPQNDVSLGNTLIPAGANRRTRMFIMNNLAFTTTGTLVTA